MPLAHPRSAQVAKFNDLQGRLRVSVTHACQLRCKFCHQEGIAAHWKPVHIALEVFGELARSYASIGGQLLEITGGEPTLHPQIGELLVAGAEAGCQVVLCTNGLQLDRVTAQLRPDIVHLLRLSLHHGPRASNAGVSARELLGRAWDFDRIERNLLGAIEQGVHVQLIFTHTQSNADQLAKVLELASRWRVDLQIVDLIASRVGDPSSTLGYMPGSEAEKPVSRYAHLTREITDRTGAVLREYCTAGGATWEIKDYHFGVLHSDMCRGCALRTRCGEGIYALRVDALGIAKPCLLRDDLEFDIFSGQTLGVSVADALHRGIAMMLASPIEWSYDDGADTPTLR